MSELKIGFLCKAASVLPNANNSKTQEILKSYYMMRCKEIAKGYGLPQRQFSEQARCSHCCLEWSKGTQTKVKPIKLSKRQRKRIKSENKLGTKESKKHLLHSNELEQTCSFCGHNTKIVIPKPNKQAIKQPPKAVRELNITEPAKKVDIKKEDKYNSACGVYNSTKQVFSLKNKKNTLKSSIKEKPKIIKNNKKRKDKFAGLCQAAVLASAKLKEEKNKQNKLNLFLKPSL